MEPPRVDDADLELWRTLWEEDRRLEPPRPSGPLAGLVAALKRFLRRFVTAPQQDLWERQRLYNMLIQHHLEARRGQEEAIGRLRDLDTGRREQVEALAAGLHQRSDEHAARLEWLEEVQKKGLDRIVRHHDAVFALVDQKLDLYRRQAGELQAQHEALFALVDQKLDRYRSQATELRSQLVSLLQVARSGSGAALEEAVEDQEYVELERRYRGTEEEIATRVEPYLPYFEVEGEILDLGCGRGEALELFREHGLPARGVDSNAEMVAHCLEKGLAAERGDLFAALAGADGESLGGVVSFHVIEHLPAGGIERLVKLAWRALAPGGVLVLETPSPLSVVVGARNFWLDPTHQRPVHPDSLRLTLELAGFERIERIDRQPFAAEDRLHEMPTAELPAELRPLAHEINRLRDQLDELLLGFQDYGMVGRKPRRQSPDGS